MKTENTPKYGCCLLFTRQNKIENQMIVCLLRVASVFVEYSVSPQYNSLCVCMCPIARLNIMLSLILYLVLYLLPRQKRDEEEQEVEALKHSCCGAELEIEWERIK